MNRSTGHAFLPWHDMFIKTEAELCKTANRSRETIRLHGPTASYTGYAIMITKDGTIG